MNSIVKICRLCLETICGNDFDAIDEIAERMLDNLLLTIDLNIIKEPLMCKKCVVNLDKSVNFKSACLSTESLSFGEIKREKDRDVHEDHKSCRFCMRESKIEGCTYLNETKDVFIADVVQKHIPELEFNLAQGVKTCTICLDALQSLSGFIMKCSDVEDKIREYAASLNDVPGQINLYDIQQLISKPMIKCESGCGNENSSESLYCESGGVDLKAEIKSEGFEEVGNLDVDIKSEEIDIKSEHSETERCQDPASLSITDGSLNIPVHKLQRKYKKCIDQRTVQLHKGITMHKCKICPYETRYKICLQRHECIHKSTSEFKCDLCSYEGKCRLYLQRHKLLHKSPSEVTMFKCELCSFETKQKRYLAYHELTHKTASEVVMFKCDLCPFETKHKGYLTRHKLKHRSSSEVVMFKCELCPYEAKHRDYLKRHMWIHKSVSDLIMCKCDLCPFETKRVDHLKQHELIHKSTAEITMYKCDLCSFETKRRDHLKRHKLIHTSSLEAAMFKCESCPFETKRSDYLKRHKLTHRSSAEITMFRCDLCAFETKYRSYIKRHKLTHKTPLQN